ncbi:MAG: class I SAM-dependent methyltransferase [Calditrichaeota bacterium]|nr:MAG: class I SAM-dependent methyltransferase [Calditrichota bacterium]
MDGYKSGWYKEWFGEDYLTVYQHRDNKDAEQLIRLIRTHIPVSGGSTILDLACGNGRHSFLLARDFPKVFGLDLSMPLLRKAVHTQTQGPHTPLFIRGDMRHLPLYPVFDLVLSLFTSFGYFDRDEEHAQVAREMARVLKPGGFLVLDYFNARYVRTHLVPEGERDMDGRRIREYRRIDGNRVVKKIEIIDDKGPKVYYESVRLFEAGELEALFRAAGITIRHIFGNYDGSPSGANSPRLILMGKKDAAS